MIKIVTDSTHYLPPELVARYDIQVVPITLSFGDQDYLEGIDIDTERFFQRLASDPIFPTTSQPAPEAFATLWMHLLEQGHEIITIVLSDKISGTFGAVQAIRKEFPDDAPISIVNSLSTAMGLGFQALRAAELAELGLLRLDIVAALRHMREHLQIILVPDTLENLHRGGRISTAKAWVGTLLNVKPLLSFSKGFIEPIQQVRTIRRAQERMLELTTDYLGDDRHPWISVMHSRSPERGKCLLDRLLPRFPGARFFFSEIGPTLGVHLGIGGTGLIVCRSNGLGAAG
ncbi:MAG: DegV family protein [Anaerolineae bacterium]|nr:DegV family protein [Anaerolineae bacterium]